MKAPNDLNESVGMRRLAPGPPVRAGDTDVQAIVGRVARGIRGLPVRSKPHVRVRGCRYLGSAGFVAVDKPSRQPARLCRSLYRQQEMSQQRHCIRAENEPLNVREVER